MTMRDCDRVHSLEDMLFRIGGVPLDPGIHYQNLAHFGLELRGSVSEPRDFHDSYSAGFEVDLVRAATAMPSPIFAYPGIETGILP